MKITDIIRGRKSENQVNRVPESATSMSWSFSVRRYADAYLWLVFRKIYDGLNNVHFYADGEDSDKQVAQMNILCDWIERNITTLVWNYWHVGYIVIDIDEHGRPYIPEQKTIKTDGYGNVIGYDLVVYSDAYRMLRKSDIAVLKENIDNIDAFKSADAYLTNSFGAFAVMCGKNMPMNNADKEDFLDEIKKKYGISSRQYQILVTTSEIDLKQLDFKIKELDLPGKVKDELMLIAGYFGVPYDLIPFSGKSTYANQEQAVVQFYRNCIAPLAEVLLSLLRYYKKKANMPLLAERISFTIDNVPELADDRTAEIEYKSKIVDLITNMRGLGLDTTEIEKQL